MTDFNEIIMDSIKKCQNHATLVQAGLTDKEAMRISFGDTEAQKAFETLATIAMKEEIKKIKP